MPKDSTLQMSPTLPAGMMSVGDYAVGLEGKGEERAGKEREGYDDGETESSSDGCSLPPDRANDAGIKRCSGGNEKGKGKGSSLKRRISSLGQGGDSSQDGDDSSSQPKKRPQPNKLESSKVPRVPNNRFPFGCPYYKRNPIEHPDCAEWHDTKLSVVKEHCKADHLKPVQCGRCRKFRAGNHQQIKQHLIDGDCEKSEIPDPSEKVAIEKAIEVEKAKTWERIYEALFPLDIPSPFWEDQAGILADLISWPQGSAAVPEEYRVGLAKFLGNRLSSTQADMDSLLIEYDENWTSRPHSQLSLLGYEDSGIDHTSNGEGPSRNNSDINGLCYGSLWYSE